MTADRYLRITNNFLHDMATGTWAACLLVLWVISSRAQGASAETVAALGDAMSAIFYLMVTALAVIGVTGGVRLRYWRREAAAEEVEEKRRVLLVKHALFVLVYGAGTYVGYALVAAT